jgi:hypothetical protein
LRFPVVWEALTSARWAGAYSAKDSGIALDLARDLSLDLPLARATKEQYDRMIAEGLGELDNRPSPSSHSRPQKHSGNRVVLCSWKPNVARH